MQKDALAHTHTRTCLHNIIRGIIGNKRIGTIGNNCAWTVQGTALGLPHTITYAHVKFIGTLYYIVYTYIMILPCTDIYDIISLNIKRVLFRC